jgi:hypothetical protein
MSTLTKEHWDVINRAIAHLEIEGCHEMADELRQVEEASQLAAPAPSEPMTFQELLPLIAGLLHPQEVRLLLNGDEILITPSKLMPIVNAALDVNNRA